MNATDQARTAYGSPVAPVRTARGTEAEAVLRVTRALGEAEKGGKGAWPQTVRALYDNRALWTVLAANVADDANALPEMLRAQIFYLAEFTQQHTREVLAGRANTEVLIEINNAILRGLNAEVAGS